MALKREYFLQIWNHSFPPKRRNRAAPSSSLPARSLHASLPKKIKCAPSSSRRPTLSSRRYPPGGRALEAAAGVARLAAARWRPLRLARWLPASRACLRELAAAPGGYVWRSGCTEEIWKLCFQI
ncbi:hypothetical protein GUJ93_ZPchr0008g13020 [Zizania palustris]|uniref:Uncharacterized protein n=1 Tax=Zizania palustris TaxID=103762 RepID=A0A8J5R4Q3_ZIZPA|nr:hypothetical protein GUJ93_ZPchr0008g13020 [Zizania palustris]